jgi:hypothetical protein
MFRWPRMTLLRIIRARISGGLRSPTLPVREQPLRTMV